MKTLLRKSFLACPLKTEYLKALVCFTKCFWQIANRYIQADAYVGRLIIPELGQLLGVYHVAHDKFWIFQCDSK